MPPRTCLLFLLVSPLLWARVGAAPAAASLVSRLPLPTSKIATTPRSKANVAVVPPPQRGGGVKQSGGTKCLYASTFLFILSVRFNFVPLMCYVRCSWRVLTHASHCSPQQVSLVALAPAQYLVKEVGAERAASLLATVASARCSVTPLSRAICPPPWQHEHL